jgi:hypothetical protein
MIAVAGLPAIGGTTHPTFGELPSEPGGQVTLQWPAQAAQPEQAGPRVQGRSRDVLPSNMLFMRLSRETRRR